MSGMNPQSPFQPNVPSQDAQQSQGPQFQQAPQQTAQQPQTIQQQMQAMQSQQPAQPTHLTQAQPTNNFIHQEKPSKTWTIVGIVSIATTVLAAAGFVWALMSYLDQKTDVDARVSSAVAEAVKEQSQKSADDYEAEKARTTQLFAGPEDYGRVSFSYRKDWSLYVKSDASSGGTYEALFNPGGVPQARNDQQYALRVTIENKDYDAVIDSYKTQVSRGDLKTSSIKSDDNNGTRLDGKFNNNVRGSAVVFKIRDKTVTIRTDAETFTADFDALIKTITFNK